MKTNNELLEWVEDTLIRFDAQIEWTRERYVRNDDTSRKMYEYALEAKLTFLKVMELTLKKEKQIRETKDEHE